MLFSPVAYADQFDNQISQLNSQVAANQAQANALHGQANTLAGQLAILNNQVSQIQSEIALDQAKANQLSQQINDAQQQLVTKKSILDEEVRAIYQMSQVSPIEMLASSKNFSDYVDKQQYNDQIKDHIQDEFAQIEQLKTSLDNQQTELTTTLNAEKTQEGALAASQAAQASLLAQTQGQEANFAGLASSEKAQVNQLRAAQAATFARFAGSDSNSSGPFIYKNLSFGGACGGGYPGDLCDYDTDSFSDQWGMYNRECVSYTAYRVAASGRSMPNWGGRGNATQWPADARAAGIPVDNSPSPGDVVIASAGMIGGVGHAMYVESVNGNWVHVSQYNWWPTVNGPTGLYSTMDVEVTPGLQFIHF